MLIDWFTVLAQVVNFLILVWLMKHFLYKPILHAIDAREKLVAAELANADKKKAEAQKESDEFKHKNEEFEKQRAALLSKAADEAKVERQRLIDEAQKAAEALNLKWQETIRNEEHNLHQEISRRTQQEVFAIARKALLELAGTSLEERLAEIFIWRLKEMDGQTKAGLAEAVKKSPDDVLVRSAFDLPAKQREAIQTALNENFSTEVHVKFESAPDIISGIELSMNGQKLSWSIADYMASMEKNIEELLKKNDKPLPKAKPEPEAKAEPKPEAKTETETKTAAQPEAKVEPKPASSAGKPEAKTEPKAESKAEPQPATKVEPKPAAKVEPKTEAKVEQKPEVKSEPKTETKTAAQPEAKVEAKPEAKTEPKTESKTEPQPETKEEPKPEAKVEPKTEAKVEPKPASSAGEPEVKAEPKTETKVAAQPEPKTEPKTEESK